jgi:hypothetical protein
MWVHGYDADSWRNIRELDMESFGGRRMMGARSLRGNLMEIYSNISTEKIFEYIECSPVSWNSFSLSDEFQVCSPVLCCRR